MNLALWSIFVHTSKGSLTCHEILQHGAYGFTSAPKEGVLWIFVAIDNPSPSAGFEPANLGYSGSLKDDIIRKIVKEIPAFMETEVSLPFSQ
jgi:hypothetical protein